MLVISHAMPHLPGTLDVALLLLRLSLGYVLVIHGLQKIDVHMAGGGLTAETQRLVADGIRGVKALAAISALTQIGAGILLMIGLVTSLAAAGAIGVMVVATTTKLSHGFWVWADGFEFPLFLCLIGAVLALSGPGRWSFDNLINLTPKTFISVGAVVFGILAGLGSVPILRQPRAHRSISAMSDNLTPEE